jgi:hypothetical protein
MKKRLSIIILGIFAFIGLSAQADVDAYKTKLKLKITTLNDRYKLTEAQIEEIASATVCDNCYNFAGFTPIDLSAFFTPANFVTFTRDVFNVSLVFNNDNGEELSVFHRECNEYVSMHPSDDVILNAANNYTAGTCPPGWEGNVCKSEKGGTCCAWSCKNCQKKESSHPIMDF